MKKRIAVFANGWGNDYLQEVTAGAHEAAGPAGADLFVFVNFSIFSSKEININGSESNIFRLPDLKDFDGTILMANSFNLQEETDYVYQKVKAAGIPAVSLEYNYEGITTINTDNYTGMYELTRHVVKGHGAKHIVFIGGPAEHWESNVRLQAVRDVMQENGLELRNEDILYGDWAKELCKDLVRQWLSSHDALPDAFVCANDVTAIGACELLGDLGYRIPEDVIVTGYDCIKQGQICSPRIASVSHEWRDMGAKAVRILLDQIEGRACEDSVVMKTRFVPAESCGCRFSETIAGKRIGYLSREIDSLACDQHFRHFYLATKKTENAEDLHNSMNRLFSGECWMEGNNFMLCLDPEFYVIEDNDANLRTEGYSEKMDVACSIRNGVPTPRRSVKYSDALFLVSDDEPEPGIYIFTPVYNEEKSYGFAMLVRDMNIIADNYLYIWTRHMNQCLEQIRRNITIADLTRKLTKLSVTDVLTGVYNRAGCEKIAYPILKEWHQSGGTGAVMIADIDRMKTINDQFGHASGDLALRTVAAVLKQELPQDWIVSRFGGDEFFAGGKLTDGTDFTSLQESVMRALALEIRRRNISFHLSISIGFAKLSPENAFDLESALCNADKTMYTVKKGHHEEMGA